jgi:hypothetical protein
MRESSSTSTCRSSSVAFSAAAAAGASTSSRAPSRVCANGSVEPVLATGSVPAAARKKLKTAPEFSLAEKSAGSASEQSADSETAGRCMYHNKSAKAGVSTHIVRARSHNATVRLPAILISMLQQMHMIDIRKHACRYMCAYIHALCDSSITSNVSALHIMHMIHTYTYVYADMYTCVCAERCGTYLQEVAQSLTSLLQKWSFHQQKDFQYCK